MSTVASPVLLLVTLTVTSSVGASYRATLKFEPPVPSSLVLPDAAPVGALMLKKSLLGAAGAAGVTSTGGAAFRTTSNDGAVPSSEL